MIGTRLGPYEITAKLGEGGMGEVYCARDAKLERDVAIKVLPAAFVEDHERLARFEREAKLLAQLNHPNIAHIYGIEAAGNAHALVMELVEGPTLAERLEQGALALDEALALARQIAEALEEAHEKGIIHRDLKPQNVKVTADGKVKVLDFGLAKAMDPAGAASGAGSASRLAASPTLTLGATVQGVILGTAAYMAPEQAAGGAADRRADIWSFGVVVYEMLSGRRLFEGETVSHVLAGVLKDEPDFSALPAETPPRILRLVRRCLRKKPRERLQAIGDARVVIDEVLADPDADRATGVGRAPTATPTTKMAWALAGVGLACAFVFAALWLRSPRPQVRSLHSELLAPESSSLGDSFALSPQGDRIAFQVYDADHHLALWLRELETGEMHRLAGTEGGELPFWSPDGRQLAFFADGRLRRLDIQSGGSQTICDAPTPRGGSWGDDGRIVFSPAFRTGLSIVPAGGGTPRELTHLDEAKGEKSHRWPVFLPGSRRLLFLAQTAEGGTRDDTSSIEALDLESGQRTPLVVANSSPLLAPGGYLLFWRTGSLFVQRFDAGRVALSGEPAVIAPNVGYDQNERALAAVGGDGTLVYQASSRGTLGSLVLTDRRGIDTASIRERQSFGTFALSHDGRRLAYAMNREAQGSTDLWLHDFERGTSQRLTFEEGSEGNPAWSPGDRAIYYGNDLENDGVIYQRTADGSGSAERVGTTPVGLWPYSAAPDGSWLVVATFGASTNEDILRYDLATGQVSPLVDGPFNESDAQLSPDGRLLAFTSEQSGRSEIYVQALDRERGRWQLSSDGGTQPRWRGDGRELYYLGPPDRLISVSVEPGSGPGAPPRFGAPVELFRRVFWSYDALPDGQSFVALIPSGGESRPLTLVTHWSAGLPR